MFTQKVLVLDKKSYTVVKIRHSKCLLPIYEEKEGFSYHVIICIIDFL